MTAPAVVTEDDIAALLEMDEADFAEVIAGTLGASSTHEDWQCLIHPSVLSRTITGLGDMVQAVQSEASRIHDMLNEHKDGVARLSSVEYGRAQRAKAELASRKVMLTARMAQAREVRREQNVAHSLALKARATERGRAGLMAVRQLALAIQRHRLASIAAGLDPEPHDRDLWAILDQATVRVEDGQLTVTEMLGRGIWTEQPEGVTP